MIRKIFPILLFLLIGLPACGFAGNGLPGKIAFRSNRFPYEKVEPMANAGTTIYMNGKLYDKFKWFYGPRWSPDGRKLLGTSVGSPPKTATIVDYETGKRSYVQVEHFVGETAWFQDGKRIAYSGYGGWEVARRIGPDNIYVFDLEQGKIIKQLTHFTDPDPEISVDGLDVSSDAKLVTFSRYDSNKTKSTMTVIDLETGDIKDLPGEGGGPRFIRGTHKIVYAEAVPDARVSVLSKKNFAVMLHDLDTGETRRITNDSRYVGIKHPSPSPDGKWICYVHDTLTGYEGKSARVIKTDGTDERILASGDDYAEVDWGP